MMGLLKSLNKEQLTLLSVSVLSVLLLLMGLTSGGAIESESDMISAETRPYHPPDTKFAELPGPDFKKYWAGRDIFKGEARGVTGMPEALLPEPRVDNIATPPLQPPVLAKELTRLRLDHGFIYIDPAAPQVRAVDMPASTEISSLTSMVEPEMKAPRDHHETRERPWDVVFLKSGTTRKGEIIEWKSGGTIRMKDPDGPNTYTYTQAQYNKIYRRWTYAEQYQDRLKNIQATSHQAHFDLADWCLNTEVQENETPTGDKLNLRKEAKERLRAAIELKKNFLEAIRQLGQLLIEDAEFEEAVKVYTNALKHVEFKKGEIHHGLAGCFEAIGVLTAARHHYRESYRVDPLFTKGRISAARTEILLGDFEAAIEILDDAINRHQVTDTNAFALRGRALLQTAKFENARSDLSKALAGDGNHARAMNDMGVLEAMQGRFGDAGKQFLAAIKADQYAIEAWVNLGSLHIAANKPIEAGVLYDGALARDPSSVLAATGRGLVKWVQGDAAGATADLEAALVAGPEHFYANYVMGQVAYRSDDAPRALQHLEKTLKASFAYVPAHYLAGLTYLKESVRILEEATQTEDKDLKDQMMEKGRNGRIQAEALFLSASEQLKGPDPFIALGCVRAAMGRSEDANDFFSKARQQREDDPLVFYGLGYVNYLYGPGDDKKRVEDSLADYFRRGSQMEGKFTDPASVEAVNRCKTLVSQLTEWLLTKVILEDRFERPDGKDVGGEWFQNDKLDNVKITLEKGRVKISGKQSNKDMALTALEIEVSKKDLYVIEATIYPEDMRNAECGFSMYYAKPGGNVRLGIHLGRDMDGNLKWVMLDEAGLKRGSMQQGWVPIRDPAPDPSELRVRFKRMNKRGQKLFKIEIWDKATGVWKELHKNLAAQDSGNFATWKVSVWGRSYKNSEYTFFVDNVRVYERSSRR